MFDSRMAELMMASFRSYTFPAMTDQNGNDVRTFHILILRRLYTLYTRNLPSEITLARGWSECSNLLSEQEDTMRKESAIRDVTKKDAGNIAIKSPAALRLRGPEAVS